MAKAIIEVLSKFPKEAVKTITCDRGSEFACWREIEKALHAGVLPERQESFSGQSRDSEKNLALINARPKKVLHFRTPQDLFQENLAKCCT